MKKMDPKVSVIIPNYNHARYLRDRIESVIQQTYSNFEIILLDDASIDGSIEILEYYKGHPKVSHFIVNKHNSGSVFKQWKKGIELAKGEYIWIAESDDIASVYFLERTIKHIDSNPVVSLIYTDSDIINGLNNKIGQWSCRKNDFFHTEKWSEDYNIVGLEELLGFLLYKVTINNASAVLFRKKFFFEENLLKELVKLQNAGDLYAYLSFALKGNIQYISEPLSSYREHDLNFSKINQNNGIIYKERFQCYLDVIQKISKNNCSVSSKSKLKQACKKILLKNGFKTIETRNSWIVFRFIKKLYGHHIFNFYEMIFSYLSYQFYQYSGFRGKFIIKKGINKF